MHKFKVGDKVTWGRGGDAGIVTRIDSDVPDYVWVKELGSPDEGPWVSHTRNLVLSTPLTELLYG